MLLDWMATLPAEVLAASGVGACLAIAALLLALSGVPQRVRRWRALRRDPYVCYSEVDGKPVIRCGSAPYHTRPSRRR
jgi:hypothetical protein